MNELHNRAARLTEGGRGLLAVDLPPARIDQVLRQARIADTYANRRAFCALLLAARGLSRVIAGVLLDPESLRGAVRPPAIGERPVLIGAEYGSAPGLVDFVLRRWVSTPASTRLEREGCARQLAEWAARCQRDTVVPVADCVVPAAERDTLETAAQRHTDVLRAMLTACDRAGVDRGALVVGVGMPTPGRRSRNVATSDDVARAGLRCLRASHAEGIAGVLFSAPARASQLPGHLAAMRWLGPDWRIGFTLGADALVSVARTWRGRPHLIAVAQRELVVQLDTASRTLRAASSYS